MAETAREKMNGFGTAPSLGHIDILSAYLEFGSEIAGRKIRLGSAQKNTTLFVRQIKKDNKWQFLKLSVFQIGDLGESVTVEELKSVFSAFGPLVHTDSVFLTIFFSTRMNDRGAES